ncbi:MAG: c-type cytochrome [Aestuariivirga sp.]|uniref:c-type cytochrome n=1 Tax=Aestuariivirga sp. TaxID=2650926 RepID=UPI0038CF6CF5
MLNKWAIAAMIAVLAVGGVGHADANGTSANTLLSEGVSLELGERDFINYCAACHGVGARGDGTIGEFLTLAVPDLTELSKRDGGQFPEARVTEVIDGRAEVKVHGMRDMPVWGDWFDAEAASLDIDRKARELIVNDRIASLVLYLKSIQAP